MSHCIFIEQFDSNILTLWRFDFTDIPEGSIA